MAGLDGKWKLETNENFDEYLKALGVSYMVRKMAGSQKPNLIITTDGNKTSIKTESSMKTTELSFEFDQEFEENTVDGRKVKSLVHKDSGTKWTHTQKGDPDSTITRELTDPNTLSITFEAKGVIAKRVFKRA